MAQITNLDGVAIAQVVIYGIFFLLALRLFSIEGLWLNTPWIFTLLFCILRIVGGALQIATIGNPSPENLLVGAAICSSVGLSLLFLVTLELLSRCNARAHKHYWPWLETGFRFYNLALHLLVVTALVLGIVGGVQASNRLLSTGILSFGILLEISSILFVVVFVSILLLVLYSFFNWRRKYLRNRALFVAVLWSLAPLLVRLIYNVLSFIAKNPSFNPFTGSFASYVGMSFVMEVLVTLVYIWGGFVNLMRQQRRAQRSRSGSRKSRSRHTSRSRSTHSSAREG